MLAGRESFEKLKLTVKSPNENPYLNAKYCMHIQKDSQRPQVFHIAPPISGQDRKFYGMHAESWQHNKTAWRELVKMV